MMNMEAYTAQEIRLLLDEGEKLPFAIEHYPSRGQTSIQELFQTTQGKFFLKRVSERNHIECQIDVESGTLAEREFWASELASAIGLGVPPLWLLDDATTVQVWLDYPDGKTYKKSTGVMVLTPENVFNCVLFDWVTGQIDRHDANYLYDFKDQRIIPVDSAHGFLKYEGALPDYLHLFEIGRSKLLEKKITSSVKRKLDALTEEHLARLVPLRSADEAEALFSRKKEVAPVRCVRDFLNLYRRK